MIIQYMSGFQIDDIGLADPASKKAFMENNTALANATSNQRINQVKATTALKQAEIDQKQSIVDAETKAQTAQIQAERVTNKFHFSFFFCVVQFCSFFFCFAIIGWLRCL